MAVQVRGVEEGHKKTKTNVWSRNRAFLSINCWKQLVFGIWFGRGSTDQPRGKIAVLASAPCMSVQENAWQD
eukprot:1731275-Rhodomonas_salina.2